jgi:hypothetical protein
MCHLLIEQRKKGRFFVVFCFNTTKKKDENKPSWLIVVYNWWTQRKTTTSQLAPCHLLPQCNKKHIPKDENEPNNFLSFCTRTKLITNSILIPPKPFQNTLFKNKLFLFCFWFGFFWNLRGWIVSLVTFHSKDSPLYK